MDLKFSAQAYLLMRNSKFSAQAYFLMRNSNLNSVSTKNQHEVSIKKERSAAVMILDNSSSDQDRFAVKLDFF